MSWACDQALTSSIVNQYQVAGPLFVQTLQSFLAAQCALIGDHLWPDDATQAMIKDPNYDFIVVGSGSAGAVVASRLSENPAWKVLLVEAGGNPNLGTEIPQLFYNSMSTSTDWKYKTQPQEGACRSYESKGCAWPRGKVLGGTSSMNGMFYVRANKADYDEWAADGNYGWSYKEVLPYFLKCEKYNGDIPDEAKKYHSTDGSINVELGNNPHPFETLVVQAAKELGLKNVSEINGDNQMGVTVAQTSVKNHYRFSTARGYLNPAKNRKNLHVVKNAYVTKILFAPGTNRVNAVLINKDGKDITVTAHKEVIVSGGAVNSPQLLMLSGIGPKKHLEEMGIELKADLPVGENLQDHIFIPMFYTMPGDKALTSLPNIMGAFMQYMLQGAGPFSDTKPHRVISFVNTTDSTSSSPDFQYHYIVLPPGSVNMINFLDKHGLTEEVRSKFNKINEDKFAMVVYNVLLKPKSTGKILLASNDPFEKPLIYANYFENNEDLACVIRGMKQHVLKLGDTEAFKAANCKLEWLKLEACKAFREASDEHLECVARELTFSLYHPTSTVKMGPKSDPAAVVDPELKVHNVRGLRVIDASIMPSIVRGNTNVPTIMIGEKGADIIKQFWLSKEHNEL